MVDRPNKPSALAATPGLPQQPQVSIDNARVAATLPTGDSVEVLLHGATVTSWKDKNGVERLWLSDAAKLDGSKPVRGGIPLVFPVFGTAPSHPQTGKLPQHGFARTSRWEYLGKSTNEGPEGSGSGSGSGPSSSRSSGAELSVKMDFGLSAASLDEKTRALWPFGFGLLYSVTLQPGRLMTSMVVTNEGDKPFEFQVLMHTYLRVKDITQVQVSGLDSADYVDKVDGGSVKTQAATPVVIEGEVDRVYTPAGGPGTLVTVAEAGKTTLAVARDNLNDVTVWNPWVDKAAGMGDFEPKDGYRHMLCIEPGSVKGWQTLEPGDSFEGSQTIEAKL